MDRCVGPSLTEAQLGAEKKQILGLHCEMPPGARAEGSGDLKAERG